MQFRKDVKFDISKRPSNFQHDLDPDYYCLKLRIKKEKDHNFCMVHFDGREIGTFSIPPHRERDKNRTFLALAPFICTEGGSHTFSLTAKKGQSKCMVTSLSLTSYTATPVDHSLQTEHPGRICLDVWGWDCEMYYQRNRPAGVYGVDLDYYKHRAIDESYKWGANLLVFSPAHASPPRHRDCLPFPWDEEDPIKTTSHYLYLDNPKWKEAEFSELTSYTHGRNMLIHWYLTHAPLDMSKKSATSEDKVARTELMERFLRKISRDFSNPSEHGWNSAIDGFQAETHGWTDDLVWVNTIMWEYNPGLSLGFYQDFALTPSFALPVPNYVTGIPTLIHLGRVRDESIFMSGYDDKEPRYGWINPQSEYGQGFVFYQLDARTNKANRKVWGEYFTQASGGTYPDWVIKQCNDAFRPRARNRDTAHETAIVWLNEAENICPDETRQYVYALGLDPIRCALAYNLLVSGVNGILAKTRKAYPEIGPTEVTGWRERSQYPARTCVIQNNYLRAYIHPRKDGGAFVYDVERLAHFDSNSLSVQITGEFIRTIITGKTKGRQQKTEIREPGGHKAVIRSTSTMTVNRSKCEEIRHFSVGNDSPCLRLGIRRTVGGATQDIGTAIGAEGYDRLLIGKRVFRKDCLIGLTNLPDDEFTLRDSRGLKPDLVVLILKRGRVKNLIWTLSKNLVLESPNVKEEEIELAFVVPTDLYKRKDLIPLRKELRKETTIKVERTPKKVRNRHPIPLSKVVKIADAGPDPYLVQEYGWWFYRGAQPSKEDGKSDFLKLYLPPNGSAWVQREGFIKGLAKPGWGCQYILAMKDIAKIRGGISCTVNVFSVTPFIFAPRVAFSNPITRAEVNGRSWHYFDGNQLFLPNRKGLYELKVSHQGEVVPHISGTSACIDRTKWRGNAFTFSASLPPWTKRIPPKLYFTASIKLSGRSFKDVRGAELLRRMEDGILVRFKPGEIMMTFKD